MGGHPVRPVAAPVVEAHRRGGQPPGDVVHRRWPPPGGWRRPGRPARPRTSPAPPPARRTQRPHRRVSAAPSGTRVWFGEMTLAAASAVCRYQVRTRRTASRLSCLGLWPGTVRPHTPAAGRGSGRRRGPGDSSRWASTSSSSASAASSSGWPNSAAAAGSADGRPGPQAEQPEGPAPDRCRRGRRTGQAGEAHLEHGADGQVTGLELVQPPLLAVQPAGQRAHGPAAPGGQPCTGDPDRQRQPGAGGEHLAGRLGSRRGPPGADDAGEQGAGLLPPSTSRSASRVDGQVGQPVAGGHEHRAGRAARQQRPDLRGVPGVVQQHQHPRPVSRVRSSAARSSSLTGIRVPSTPRSRRNLASTSAGASGCGPAPEQVHVELAVGELRAQPVRGVHGQGGLAQPAGAGHHADLDRPGVVGLVPAVQLSTAVSRPRRGR